MLCILLIYEGVIFDKTRPSSESLTCFSLSSSCRCRTDIRLHLEIVLCPWTCPRRSVPCLRVRGM